MIFHKNEFNLKKIQALVIDIDGTLMRGKTPQPGLTSFFQFLHQHRIKFIIASNNATKSPKRYVEKFNEIGVKIELSNVITCSTATAEYLRNEYPPETRVYIIGQSGLREAILEAGFRIGEDASQNAEVVIVGGDYALTYDKLKYATLHIQRGALFIGTNPDLVYPNEEGLVPECGATLAALEAATGVSPMIIGKPERYLFDMAVHQMNSKAEETAILGDRLDTDIIGGQKAGLKTILITTGVDTEKSIDIKNIHPNLIIHSLDELVNTWSEQISDINST